MSMAKRVMIAVIILLLDLGVFFLPLTAVFLVYIIIVNPPWFRQWLNNLDAPGGG